MVTGDQVLASGVINDDLRVLLNALESATVKLSQARARLSDKQNALASAQAEVVAAQQALAAAQTDAGNAGAAVYNYAKEQIEP